jgi:hypothetical protein
MSSLQQYGHILDKLDAADAIKIQETFQKKARSLASDLSRRGALNSVHHLIALVNCEVDTAKRTADAKLNNAIELMRAKNLGLDEENAGYLETRLVSFIDVLKTAPRNCPFDAKRMIGGFAYGSVMGSKAIQLDRIAAEIRGKIFRLKQLGMSGGFSDAMALSKVFKSIYEINHAVNAKLFEFDLSEVSELVDPDRDFG